MLIACIHLKSRLLKWKIIRDNKNIFTYKDFDYEIIPDRIYIKKIGTFKLLYSIYLEDYKFPICLEKDRIFDKPKISSDMVRYSLSKLKNDKLEYIMVGLLAVILLMMLLIMPKLMG